MSNPLYNQNDKTKPIPALNWFIEIDGVRYYEILDDHIENARPGQYINLNGVIYDRVTTNFRNPRKLVNGYWHVTVHLNDGNDYHTAVHRLLMLMFKWEYGCEKLVVNHIDGDKNNFSFDNLEWCTSSENSLHAYSTGLIKHPVGEDCHFSKLTENDVREICKELEKPRYDGQFTELAGKYNVDPSTITSIARGRTWTNISKDFNVDYSKSGVCSILTEDQVREICEELSKTRYLGQNVELGRKYGVNPYIITQIATGQNWTHISKDYNILPPVRERRVTDEDVHTICQILQEYGKLDAEVFDKISSTLNMEMVKNNIQCIRRIFRREQHTDISNQYKW